MVPCSRLISLMIPENRRPRLIMRAPLRFSAPRVVRIGVALLLAAAAALVYRSAVVSQFIPVSIQITDSELYASQRVVALPLPDISSLRQQTAVLEVRLRND